MINVCVFDIGGTLMEYQGMPNSWVDYYEPCFRWANQKLALNLSEEKIKRAVEIMKQYNPRIHYHEKDYPPEMIFREIVTMWAKDIELNPLIVTFFEKMKLRAELYEDSIPVLQKLRQMGIKIAALTDVAVGMPDDLHKKYCKELLPYFDMYVSSISCGYRKPNPNGLREIAQTYEVSADEMIFVGDEEKDMETAKRFGCKSILVDRKHTGADYGQYKTVLTLDEFEILFENHLR